MTDVLIIGAGPAGLTAAIYAARAGVSVLVLEKNMYGGQAALTSEVDNFPTRPGMLGADFASSLYEHATAQGAQVLFEEVTMADLAGTVKKVTTPAGVHEARSVIIAGGAARKRLNCPGEEEYTGKGVSYCATCDAAFFRGKTVAVAGGGDTALNDALFLSNQCEKVYIIHRREAFRAQKVVQDAVRARGNIELMQNCTVHAVEGDEVVRAIQVNTPDGLRALPLDGLFVAIGLHPETDLYVSQLPLDGNDYFPVDESCATPLPGVFVAGDLRTKPLRQIVTAAADGAVAAVAAAEYCNALDEDLCGVHTAASPLPFSPGAED